MDRFVRELYIFALSKRFADKFLLDVISADDEIPIQEFIWRIHEEKVDNNI